MTQIDKQGVLDALRNVKGPDLEGDIVSLGLVSDIVISGDGVFFSLSVDAARARGLEPLRRAAEQAALKVAGVAKAAVVLTAERKPGAGDGSPAPPPTAGGNRPGAAPRRIAGVPGVKAIVAVASGKGGVGKSTTAANLALAFAANDLSVGILDADIYGPSMPRLLGVTGRPRPAGGRMLNPLRGYGVKVMSMGFMVDDDTPMIWRGPMVISALTQMLREVAWGDLDILVVDMPPGTGDAQLTMAQQVPLAGAIIVSTPQDLALIDARKGLNMFRRVDVPVLGIIENMSYFACPACGRRSEIFGHGGAREEAEKLGVPFLGEVPLDMELRKRSDGGQPIVVSLPDSAHAGIYRDIAKAAWDRIGDAESGPAKPAPKIVIE